ncbi:hypothetical protein [Nostoc parmelioides]|uniref:Uncharacterized protein n=1 Tax=Nostoc parmelioides FACHB-3921 TaxID=2692909 RepID=A0ABR8BFB5_9NOSO|nr:hypothetical protein [Nostoc parmelioides]MBD2252793.1 hypothetical protein [Nostoc parmelioides FACHB-3921]
MWRTCFLMAGQWVEMNWFGLSAPHVMFVLLDQMRLLYNSQTGYTADECCFVHH